MKLLTGNAGLCEHFHRKIFDHSFYSQSRHIDAAVYARKFDGLKMPAVKCAALRPALAAAVAPNQGATTGEPICRHAG